MEVGGCHGGERTTHLQRREGDGFLSSTSNTTPTCVCACDCVLGARAVVAHGVRRQLCLLPWDLWGVDWSGGVPWPGASPPHAAAYAGTRGQGDESQGAGDEGMGMKSGGGRDKGLHPALPTLPEAVRRVAG